MTANWAAFTTAEPDFAQRVEERFGAFTHHTLATLRKDGSPRTSGLEVRFLNGELWLGMMPDSLKALDLRRGPRFALQANPGEGTGPGVGDVRVAGRAVEVRYSEDSGHTVSGMRSPASRAIRPASFTACTPWSMRSALSTSSALQM